jgi:hypothetical protein
MVVGFTTTYAISAYRHLGCKFEFCSWRGAHDTTLCDKIWRWLTAGRCLFSTNKTEGQDITEILMTLAQRTITTTLW